MKSLTIIVFLTAVTLVAATPGVVVITPLGSHAGDFCRNDRALLFEDPTGVRVLWDPGRTIAGESDDRLGDIHVLVLSSVHSDHIGEVKKNSASPGTCAAPGTVSAAPNSNAASIAAAKNAVVFTGGEMSDFVARKIQNIRGSATAACPAAGLTSEVVVPRTDPCTATLRPGGSRTVRFNNATAGVKIAVVPAFHSNGIPAALVDSPSVAAGTTAYGGNDGGAVLQFTNGLSVYLTADSGMFGDMEAIVKRYYKPSVVVINMGDTATMGPDEAAFAVRELIKPRTVIPSHGNEAATTGGNVNSGTRLERFIQLVRAPRPDASWVSRLTSPPIEVVLPLSDAKIRCDSDGRCQ
ncbi:MAG: metal-dependent hydrolase [Acidobacteria bacterium]|nr:MAG: metal-dependent hydrolase [Acidobacteriota bacterium]